jgi:hypothetical protein
MCFYSIITTYSLAISIRHHRSVKGDLNVKVAAVGIEPTTMTSPPEIGPVVMLDFGVKEGG